jgi:hypothetical protein
MGEKEGGGAGLNLRSFMEFLRDLWQFLKERKKWWLVPLIILIVLIAVLVILGGSSALAPFIYTLF